MVWPRKVRLLPNDRQTSQNCHDLSSNVGLLPPPVRSHLPSHYNGSSMSTSTSGVRGSTSVVRSPPHPWPQVKPGHSELDIVGALGGKQSLQRQLPSNVDWSVSVMLHAYPCMTKLSNYHSVLHRRGTGSTENTGSSGECVVSQNHISPKYGAGMIRLTNSTQLFAHITNAPGVGGLRFGGNESSSFLTNSLCFRSSQSDATLGCDQSQFSRR